MRPASLLSLLLALLVAACTKIEPIPAPTQVMVRISNSDEELLAQMDALRVAVRLNEGARWRDPASKNFAAAGLRWPVEIPVTPRVPAEASSEFEVVVDALRAGEVIAQTRLVTSFVEDQQRVEELELYLCRNDQGIAVCAEADCVGSDCRVCSKSGSCEVAPRVEDAGEPIVVTEMDAGQDLDAADSMGGSDGAVHDAAETGATVVLEYALGVAGAACAASLEQSLGCEGHASRKILKCQQGMWQVLQTCSANERCESRVGTDQGTCTAIPAACAGKSPGDVCDGTARLECGIDLVNVTSKPCGAHMRCDAASSKCVCDVGYEADAQGVCVNPNDCPSGVCGGGHCVDGLANWSCDCNEGFAGTGTKACSAVLYCPKDACTPGGTCVDSMNWSCQCGTGFTGSGTRACMNQNDCPSDRCRAPNATCADLVGSYRCDCNPGFSGPDCVNDICNPNPCRNGGTCSRTGTLCTCPTGFSGVNCQTDVCNPNPCQHGGVCTRGTTASCNCAGTGYQGGSCEIPTDPCSGTTNACGGSCMRPLAHPPGENCSNGLLGACARAGKYVCQGTTATVCNAPSVAAGAEVCGDGMDNDCDGSADEADATNASLWYEDCDGDGYSALTQALLASNTGVRRACVKPASTTACSGGWTATRPQAPQTGVQPVNWDCDDSTRAYSPGAAFGIPPDGKTRIDLNCDNIEQKDDAIGTPFFGTPGFGSSPRCSASSSCTECAMNVDGTPRNGAQWLDSSFNPTNAQPPCSRSGSDAQVARMAVEIVGGVCTGSGNWGTTFVNAVQKCR